MLSGRLCTCECVVSLRQSCGDGEPAAAFIVYRFPHGRGSCRGLHYKPNEVTQRVEKLIKPTSNVCLRLWLKHTQRHQYNVAGLQCGPDSEIDPLKSDMLIFGPVSDRCETDDSFSLARPIKSH